MLFFITDGFESAFNAVFNLLGWEGTLSSPSSPLHGLYMVIYTIGWALLAFAIILLALQSFTHAVKWSKVLPNIILVALTISVLPAFMHVANQGTAGIGNIAISAKDDVSKAQLRGASSSSSLAIQPIHDNIVDLARVANHKWNYDPNTLNMASTNTITSRTDVMNLNLGETINKTSVKNFKGLSKAGDGFPAVSDPFFYKFEDNSVDDGDGSKENSYSITKVKGLPIVNTPLSDTYLRYSVNWLGLIGQCIALGIILLLATIRVVKDIVELTAMQVIAPLMAYKSVHNSKPLRDLISSMIGAFVSMVLMFVVIKMFLLFLTVAPALANKTVTGPFVKALVDLAIYIGGGYAMFAGVSYFERVCGVSQGFGDEAGHAGAALALGATGVGLGMTAAGHMMNGISSAANKYGGSSNKNSNSHGLKNSSNNKSGGNPNLNNSDNGHSLNDNDQNEQNTQQNDQKNQLGDQNNQQDENKNDQTNDTNNGNTDNGQPLDEQDNADNQPDDQQNDNPNLDADNGKPLDESDNSNIDTDEGQPLDSDDNPNLDSENGSALDNDADIDSSEPVNDSSADQSRDDGASDTNIPNDVPHHETETHADSTESSKLSPEQRQANMIAEQVERRLHPKQSRGDKLINAGHNITSRGWNGLTSHSFGASQRGHISGRQGHRYSDD